MKIDTRWNTIMLLMFATLIWVQAHSQKLINSRTSSYLTYIYKLSDQEAKEIYKHDLDKVKPSFFHTLVDSFPTDSTYGRKLMQGHYLKTYADKNHQRYSISSIKDFDVFVSNNSTDLSVQVLDLRGNVIRDASVNVRAKHLQFDKKTQTYVERKSNRRGLLEVHYKEFTAYYLLGRQYNNSAFKRAALNVGYRSPLKYIWLPIRYVVKLPIDGVKSIIKGHSLGVIYSTKNFFNRTFSGNSNKFGSFNRYRQYKGYLVFNKPKYHLGDTVKFKAFLVTKEGKPVNQSLEAVLNEKKRIFLGKLEPYNEGGYAGQFLLHDSLQLQLDNNYLLRLETNKHETLIYGQFRYEDYELSSPQVSLRTDKTDQFWGQTFKLFVKGTDENELNLQDAHVQVLAKARNVSNYFDRHVFVPDTLSYFERKLEPIGETEIIIPDSLFPKANFAYELMVRVLTSDNEVISASKWVNYYFDSETFEMDLQTDSILFRHDKNGKSTPVPVRVTGNDNFGNETEVFRGNSPCKVALEPIYASYTVASDSLSRTFEIPAQSSLLQYYSRRTNDSVVIVTENPRKIPFGYTVYKQNSEVTRGYSDSLNFSRKAGGKENYFASIRYLWAGKIREQIYRIPFNDKKLNISVTQPKIVYPGQKSRIEILVTDAGGKPVEGVDLTAYSLTKKFNYSPPPVPVFAQAGKGKSVINNFHIDDFRFNTNGVNLNWGTWKLLAGLDSIEYYRLIYPANSIYRFEYPTPDSTTQFAPFVISKGETLPIHVIYVDAKPVYFDWSTISQPYSFKVDSGYHQIKLRTSFKTITMDSIYFNAGKKLIFSLDEELRMQNVRINVEKPELSQFEQQWLYPYIFPFRNTFGDKYAYLSQDNNIQLLSPTPRMVHNLAGPIAGKVSFEAIEGFTTHFDHDPYFEYDFAAGLLKMRSIEKNWYPKYLEQYRLRYKLADVAFTKDSLYKLWEKYRDTKRYLTARYQNPHSTTAGHGELRFRFEKTPGGLINQPLNMLVFKYGDSDFLRVYPGLTTNVKELSQGYYRLLFFYPGARYQNVDSVFVKSNGLNYYEFKQPPVLARDSFSFAVNKLIEEKIFIPAPEHRQEEQVVNQNYDSYQHQFQFSGNGDIIEGFVYENDTNEPLIGVSVLVKGTSFGAVTNANGYYKVKVPRDHKTLVFAYIGYERQERQIGWDDLFFIRMVPAVSALNEVVVVAYGRKHNQSMSNEVASYELTNDENALQGKVSGFSVDNNDRSKAKGITLKGSSSLEFDHQPLYIVNGNVYNGDILKLNPKLIRNVKVLKGAEATALYGARAANGVLVINTDEDIFKDPKSPANKGADYDPAFLETASSSIRDHFSDDAFWQPRLVTDKDGKASFEVTFPDDVTSWETFFLAMNGKKQSGQTRNLVKSYKPVMAQLALPRFLVQSDTASTIGKALNYSPDSVRITSDFELDGKPVFKKTRWLSNSALDTLNVVAGADSISLKYFLKKVDGYFDGEKRAIPVFPLGLEKTKGSFYVLDKDSTAHLSFDAALGGATISAHADVLDVIDDEITYLKNYRYSCNEQLASKLKALLAEKTIYKFQNKKFKGDHDVEKLIRLLQKNRKDSGLWGWWRDSEESMWMSLHVLEALLEAEKKGCQIAVDKEKVAGRLIFEFQSSRDLDSGIRILKILKLINAKVDYKNDIAALEKKGKPDFNELLQLMELKRACILSFDADTLRHYQKSTMIGNIYYADNSLKSNLLTNDIQNTLLAYKVLKVDSVENEQTLQKIRNWFFEVRPKGHWQNTFESAQIIETLLPDLLKNRTSLEKSALRITGDVVQTVTQFPFEMKVAPNQKITVTKTGAFPVYLSSFQKYWDKAPKVTQGDFEITTHFEKSNSEMLKAGEEVTLTAEVKVKHDAQYVMINIPIPGGCSYGEKLNYSRNESHREYFKNETAIFCELLPAGCYSFEVKLVPRFTGVYVLNPAKVELMYFPILSGNNEIRKVRIQK